MVVARTWLMLLRVPQQFQFVNFHDVMEKAQRLRQHPDPCFALAALMEIPEQYALTLSLSAMSSLVLYSTLLYACF